MASKPKKQATQEGDTYPRKAIPCLVPEVQAGVDPSDDEKGRAYATLVNSPELAAYRIVALMQPKSLGDGIDAPTLLTHLRDQAMAVNRGDLAHAEAMLANQASALQALFVRLSERAMEQTQMPHIEGFMRMALRAQSQCRATLETLAAIKNPPVVYARQANVTTGPQQINNGAASPSRAREIESEQTQLSKGAHELLPNTRASGNASRANSTLEALGEVHRTQDIRG